MTDEKRPEFKLNVEIIKETDPGNTIRQYCPNCASVRSQRQGEILWPEFRDIPEELEKEIDNFDSLCPTCLLTEMKSFGYDLSFVIWRGEQITSTE